VCTPLIASSCIAIGSKEIDRPQGVKEQAGKKETSNKKKIQR
jgi:hypothetical protein